MTYQFPHRPRRLRSNSAIRALVEECRLTPADFVLPVFISYESVPSEITSMPGVFRWPLSHLQDQLKVWREMGIRSFALFPKVDPKKKNSDGSEILNQKSLVYRAATSVKNLNLDILLIADLALDPYTTHGQDGVLDAEGGVDNDRTVEMLAN
ncbi:MAG: porphobilinogen synthase, partial [Opitutae bacterium]